MPTMFFWLYEWLMFLSLLQLYPHCSLCSL
jgi:hypothetical protein